MSKVRWSRFPLRVGLLLTTALAVPLAALLWVGWRVLEQDRALEDQQVRQRVERAADIAVAALQRAMAATERRLAEGSRDWPEGAVTMTMEGRSVQVHPVERVAYLSMVPPLPEPPLEPFAAGEAAEFRQHDPRGAASAYRHLADSDHQEVRVGALLRLGRCLQAAGQPAEALAVYARLLKEDRLAFAGMPVSLVARYARCRLMEALKREGDLRREAGELATDLQRGRWLLTRQVAQLHLQDAVRWGIAVSPRQAEREWLVEGLDLLWQKLSREGAAGAGCESLPIGPGEALVALWIRSGDRVTALVATHAFAAAQWLGAIEPVLQEQHVKLTLYNGSGKIPSGAIRRAGDTGLPWTVVASGRDPEIERGQFQQRRQMLALGFLTMALLALLAAYLMFRALSREFAAARLQSDFVAAVSHEFRTPLTSLRQFTDMLREHPNLGEERRAVCYEAQARATARLTRLVEALLDFGRMEGGARVYRLETADCGELVGRLVEEFRREAPSSAFEVHCMVRSTAEIDADPEALGRAIWNLLDNAVKYSGDSREIEVTVEAAGGEVTIAVQDRGLGIPAAEQSGIFRKFQRGGQAIKLGIKGTGIGLAMVDHIVKAHRGRIGLRSRPGEGSTFTIILPIKG